MGVACTVGLWPRQRCTEIVGIGLVINSAEGGTSLVAYEARGEDAYNSLSRNYIKVNRRVVCLEGCIGSILKQEKWLALL